MILALLLAFSPFAAFAQTCPTCVDTPPEDEGDNPTYGSGNGSDTQFNLEYRGGETLPHARVVYIFWGSVPAGYAAELQAYRDHSGGMGAHMWMLAQYDASQAGSSLKGPQADVFDPVEPPSEVTDAAAKEQVRKHFTGRYDYDAVYVLVLPYGVVSSQSVIGSEIKRSCAGTQSNQMCGYHNYFRNFIFGPAVKYAVIPYASCSACHKYTAEGHWANDVQNAEVTTLHEVRSVMLNPELDGWWDNEGREADDKCAFVVHNVNRPDNIFRTVTPASSIHLPNYTPGHVFFFQKEWSNNANSSWWFVPGDCVE